jgi:hypothetical protein
LAVLVSIQAMELVALLVFLAVLVSIQAMGMDGELG